MNQNKLDKYSETTFESIKHINEFGVEYWNARELQVVLDYKEWRKFENVIIKAKISCQNSEINVLDHFVHLDKMVEIGSGAKRKQVDYKLSRYACYLIVQNADSRKEKDYDIEKIFWIIWVVKNWLQIYFALHKQNQS